MSFSVCVAIFPENAITLEELVYKSDIVMYQNKINKVNLYLNFFDNNLSKEIVYENMLKSELDLMLLKNEFELYYSIIFDNKNCIEILEANIHWKNKRFINISDEKFIKILEKSNKISEIGYWIIENICKDYVEFKKIKKDIKVSIDIFHRQLMDNDFGKNIEKIIQKYNLDFNFICFEMKEIGFLETDFIILENLSYIYKYERVII